MVISHVRSFEVYSIILKVVINTTKIFSGNQMDYICVH